MSKNYQIENQHPLEMFIMSSIIKSCQNSFSKKDNYDSLLKDKNVFSRQIKSSSILSLEYLKRIINKKYNLKLKSRTNRQYKSIGKHIILILFMANIMIKASSNSFNKKGLNNSANMENKMMANYHHPMYIESLLQQITPSLSLRLCKYLMNAMPMLKSDIKPIIQPQISTKKEIFKMMTRTKLF